MFFPEFSFGYNGLGGKAEHLFLHEVNPFEAPRAPIETSDHETCDDQPACRIPLIGAVIGSLLLMPLYILLAVNGHDPADPSKIWGWCPGAVVAGALVGVLIGGLLGGFIGVVVWFLRLLRSVVSKGDARRA